MKIEFSRQIFETFLNIKFHENLSIASRAVPYGRTDRQKDTHDEILGTRQKMCFITFTVYLT
jgi:hypothetical protein